MYLVANINVEICAAKSCKLCTQYCPEANTIQYSEDMGKDKGSSMARPMWRWIGVRAVRNVCGSATIWPRTMPLR